MPNSFPVFRLVTLLARQIAAPVARKLKEHAAANEWFRRHVCLALGRGYHTAALRLRLWALALPAPRTLPPLPERAALESGTTLLGETIVFALGSIILIFELNRQKERQEAKELRVRSQWVAILLQLEELQREVALQQQDIDRLLGELRRLAPRHFPPSPMPASPDSSTVPPSAPKLPADHPTLPSAPLDLPSESCEPCEPCGTTCHCTDND